MAFPSDNKMLQWSRKK